MRTIYYRADVVLADVVFSGGLGSKLRPVIVVSTEAYNQSGIKLIGAAITSNLNGTPRLGDVILTDWQTAGLAFPSAVRGIVITVDRVDIHRVLGVMSPADFANVEKALALIMGF
jgi:mRNA-degrading endonuclease toxin of MazEF toxin-antitoxin module